MRAASPYKEITEHRSKLESEEFSSRNLKYEQAPSKFFEYNDAIIFIEDNENIWKQNANVGLPIVVVDLNEGYCPWGIHKRRGIYKIGAPIKDWPPQ